MNQLAEEQGKQVEQETEVAPGNLIVFDVRKLARFRDEGPFVQVLRGRITFTAAGNIVRLQAGMVLQVEAQVPHHVVALTQTVLLVTMVPSPAYHSLEREVFLPLAPLVTRAVSASEQGGEYAIEKEQ
jgi:mannose-6-phosphate isomerase-like protein (cupin superfamily)